MNQPLGETNKLPVEIDVICMCGHSIADHELNDGACNALEQYGKDNYEVRCECSFFFPDLNKIQTK